MTDLERADGFRTPAGHSGREMASACRHPGSESIELEWECAVTMEISASRLKERGPLTSLNGKEEAAGVEKSELPIRAMKSGNAGGAKGQRFGKWVEETCPDTERTLCMTTRLICFTRRARAELGARFTALMGLLAEPEGLRESFENEPGNKAPGVDGEQKQEYAQGVEGRLVELSSAVRRLGVSAPAGAQGVYREVRRGPAATGNNRVSRTVSCRIG